MHEDDWKRGLQSGSWGFKTNYGSKTDAFVDLFANLKCVRLNAVAANVVGKELEGFWRMSVRPPTTGIYIHLDNTQVTVEQQEIPAMIFGRVSTRQILREPDFAGRSSIKNFSPIGHWSINVGEQSTHGENRDRIEDVELDIEVTYQA